jgi:hypothetical protein
MRKIDLLDQNSFDDLGDLFDIFLSHERLLFRLFDNLERLCFEEGESSAKGGVGQFQDPFITVFMCENHSDKLPKEVEFIHTVDADTDRSGYLQALK